MVLAVLAAAVAVAASAEAAAIMLGAIIVEAPEVAETSGVTHNCPRWRCIRTGKRMRAIPNRECRLERLRHEACIQLDLPGSIIDGNVLISAQELLRTALRHVAVSDQKRINQKSMWCPDGVLHVIALQA